MKYRWLPVLCCALFLLLPFVAVEACGPFFTPDVFVPVDHPQDLHAFAQGQLGILQTTYDSNDLVVAYRYLNGGALSPLEQKTYAPPAPPVTDWESMSPKQRQAYSDQQKQLYKESKPDYPWTQALAKYAPASETAAQHRPGVQPFGVSLYYNPSYPNCPRPAFQTAATTLASRANSWGKQSPWLANWINAQRTVFSNCPMKSAAMPAPAPAGSPALLQADRAYQTAAAEFYAGNYDQARRDFHAIASDPSSPWRIWGDYLAARAEVRAAFAAARKTNSDGSQDAYLGNGETAGFDKPTMLRAQHMLQALLAHNPGLPRTVILDELSFVRLRTEPAQRLAEICAALAGPAPDRNFAQDLIDLSYALENHIASPNSAPLLAWIAALRSHDADDALRAWKQTPTLPRLVAALIRTPATDPSVPQLLEAAARVRRGSPAWATVMFHRVRLLTGAGRANQARALLDQFLPAMRRQPANATLNAFLGERMAVARTLSEFLEYAPRTVLERTSEGYFYQQNSCPPKPGGYQGETQPCLPQQPLEFAMDSATVLNRAPLAMLVEAARSPHLPANLRQQVAAAAWTRSVVLGDAASAAQFVPLLPPALHLNPSGGVGFHAVLTILRNPGLRPYVEAGISHLNRPGNLDLYRNNWWCDAWTQQFPRNHQGGAPASAPSFFTSGEAKTGASQYAQVLALPPAPEWLGHRVLDYAKGHLSDPDVPEALALTVRATHYACLSWASNEQQAGRENTAVSKAAFELLHRRFPKSPWTARTPYYY